MEILNNNNHSSRYVKPDMVHKVLSSFMLADGYDFVLDIEQSQGSVFKDARTGKEFIDFFSFFASIPIGMNHPKMRNKEVIELLGRAALTKPSNSDIYTSEMATFVKTFFEIAVPDYFKHAFFISGGALAVENALKTAFDWKVRRNFRKGYISEHGSKILHFKQAFHGRSGYTMSMTNTENTKVMYFPKFDWPRVTNPKLSFPLNEINLEKVIELEKVSIEQIKRAFINNPDDIAAIIIEPIQGEGGDNHFRKEFLQQLRQLADENEALLIFDEIQTGVGITGTMWAHQQLDVKPDIMCFGKKMQICGILVGDKIESEPENVFHLSSRINSTWGGNLIDMVRSTLYLEIIAEENLLENAKNMGTFLSNKMFDLQSKYPSLISNVRNKGLFASFDFSDIGKRKAFLNASFRNGLMILPCGEKSIRFRPVLDINQNIIDRGFEIIDNSIKEILSSKN